MKKDVFGFLKKCVELLRKFLPSDELAEVEKEYVKLTENEQDKRKSYAEYMRKYRKNYVNLTRKSYSPQKWRNWLKNGVFARKRPRFRAAWGGGFGGWGLFKFK